MKLIYDIINIHNLFSDTGMFNHKYKKHTLRL